MGSAIRDLIPYALGMAASPIAVIAVILMLLSKRGSANSASFLAGWIVGVVGASVVTLVFARMLHDGSAGASSDLSSIVKVVLGAFLLLLAARSFRKRPKPGQQADLPKWLQTIDSLTPMKSAVVGAVSPLGGGLNPTNLILIAGAMVTLSRDHLAPGSNAIVILVFTLIGISTVAAPVGLYLAGGKKARLLLDRSKTWLTQNNATVTAVMLLVIGGVLLVEGIRDLSA